MFSFIRLTHETDSSRRFHTIASPPPDLSTRATSARAASASNQWKAWAAVTASTEASGNGMASAVPSSTSTPATEARSSSPISLTGSTATVSAPVGTKRAVNLPVPAARSSTFLPGPSPSSPARKAIASSGYEGRPRADAPLPAEKPAAAVSWISGVLAPCVGFGVRPPALWRGVLLPHHQLAPEVADLFAALVEALGLNGHHAAIVLGLRLDLVEHPGLGVDGVAVEGRLLVGQRLDLEVGDARPAHVRHAHPQHQRIDEVADDHVLALDGLVLGEPRVGM